MFTSNGDPREFSIPFNPILSCGDNVCSGSGCDLDDSCSEPVIAGAGFRGSVRAGAAPVPIVWRERARSRWWSRDRSFRRPRPKVRLDWD